MSDSKMTSKLEVLPWQHLRNENEILRKKLSEERLCNQVLMITIAAIFLVTIIVRHFQ